MRRLFRILLLALVLVAVFLVSAMTAMRFAIHGREVTIPRLIGMTPVEAERAANANGLLLDMQDRLYSADVPEGRVLSQTPPAGQQVRRGWKVRVAQSLGPQRVPIPNLVGQSVRAAEINLTRRGLEMGSVATVHLPDHPAEQVVAQSPLPDALGVASPKVNLLMTAPAEDKPVYYVMPDFVGRRFGEATSAMAEAGFRVGTVTVKPKTLPANVNARLRPIATDVIISQSPARGQKVGAGAAVNFELSR
jgi:eukaryotic-like serine/threonine-protein kinase